MPSNGVRKMYTLKLPKTEKMENWDHKASNGSETVKLATRGC